MPNIASYVYFVGRKTDVYFVGRKTVGSRDLEAKHVVMFTCTDEW